MQIKDIIRIRNITILITLTCAAIVANLYLMDTNSDNVNALVDYIMYSNQCVQLEEDIAINNLPESCSMLLRNDSLYKSSPDHLQAKSFSTVEEMTEFVDGWIYGDTVKVNPYINAYIKQSLWEYADWCINEESEEYWHMKYIASQMTGGYSYARQIKYKWYKLCYNNTPFAVIVLVFVFVFVNVLCIMYCLNGSKRISKTVKKMPRWENEYSGNNSENSEEN